MFGRRADGRRVKGIDPVMQITPYVMPMRCDAQVFLKHRADMEILSRYIRQQKQEKNQQITYMQIVVAAYVRAMSRNPEVNRFIMNKQLFARNNCSAAFTILNPITKVISRYYKSILNCKRCVSLADRVYIYDNSIDDVDARLLFRMTGGRLFKQYTDDIPEWALTILH